MGLDMYALTTTETPPAPVDFEISHGERLHYWRKHPDLHGWMEALYREKHGSAESFNCVNLALTADDFDRLEADIRESRLPHTEGFFFGDSDGSELEDDLTFIEKARKAISDDLTVYYTSWW
jgi:hypothetical protein